MSPTVGPLEDFTIPRPGSTTARRVLSIALGRLPAELLRTSPRVAGPYAAELRQLQEVAVELARTKPGPLVSVLRRPTVGGLLRCLRASPRDGPAIALQMVGNALLELALTGALPRSLDVKRLPERLTSLGTRTVARVPPGASARFEPGRVRIGDRTVQPEPSPELVPVDEGTLLALVDDNPLAMFELHPDKSGNALDLGGRSSDEWAGALRAAFAPIAEHEPDLRADLDLYVQELVPVGYEPEKHLSASYQEAIGIVYLSLHPHVLTLTEALIHEAQHNKLNALFELDPLLENAFSPLYASPVRPDPRPLHGVLLAVHAFLPIARLYERMIAAGATELRGRFEAIRRINHEGAAVLLPNAKPTSLGAELLAEIARWDAHFGGAA